jgi:hypothetical protein
MTNTSISTAPIQEMCDLQIEMRGHSCVAAICLIWYGDKHLPEEVVAYPVENAGSPLMLNNPYE